MECEMNIMISLPAFHWPGVVCELYSMDCMAYLQIQVAPRSHIHTKFYFRISKIDRQHKTYENENKSVNFVEWFLKYIRISNHNTTIRNEW